MSSKVIGESLKSYFDSINLNQQQVAERLGVSPAAVNQLLNGKPFGRSTSRKWHEEFGFDAAWLMTGTGTMFGEDSTSVSQTITGNSGVAIQQNGTQNSASPTDERFFTRLCADLMQQIMERDQRICCLEKELNKYRNE